MRNVIEVSTRGSSLSIDGALLAVRCPDREPVTVPVADLECLLLHTEATTLSGAVLERMADAGVPVIVCRSHKPVGWLTSLPAHERVSARQDAQVGASHPLRKRLWSSLVEAKIANQAAVLRTAGADAEAGRLAFLAAHMRSGDPDNKEGQAAQVYWPALFGPAFRRSRDGGDMNPHLNYGYTVLRAMTARRILETGLLASRGLAHRSARDGLALADDLMEPFRPVVDMVALAIRNAATGVPAEGLRPADRHQLVGALHAARLFLDGEPFSPSEALRRLTGALVESFENGTPCLPSPRIER